MQVVLEILEKRLEKALEIKKMQFPSDVVAYLQTHKEVALFFKGTQILEELYLRWSIKEIVPFFVFLLLDQEKIQSTHVSEYAPQELDHFIRSLSSIDVFYKDIGGLLGYYIETLQAMIRKNTKQSVYDAQNLFAPPKEPIQEMTKSVAQYIKDGIYALNHVAEIYVVGGAADRLCLIDQTTKKSAPSASLPFCGKSLLEILIRDIEAKEYLYWKLTGQRLITPLVLMTSVEKGNHTFVQTMLEKHNWYGRPRDSFIFIMQPHAPMISENGDFLFEDRLQLFGKPGGHGVLWKVAQDTGVFDLLRQKGYTHCIVRQINNPIAGIDYNLLALSGYGYSKKKAFGFCSCPRKQGAAEGVNVLLRRKNSYCITNVEYTDAIGEHPGYKDFPANTNILFISIDAIQNGLKEMPFPGLLVNPKKGFLSAHGDGEMASGRLESTMQNIAEVFGTEVTKQQEDVNLDDLDTFLLVNERRKTISVTKKALCSDTENIDETPLGCFYDLMEENKRLLQSCGMMVPQDQSTDDYLQNGPSTIFLYSPAIGPLYTIIQNKIRGGVFGKNSELVLDIADAYVENLALHGSLSIATATSSLCLDREPGIFLKNVTVKNKGIARVKDNNYWANEIQRNEACSIILEEGALFFAENVVLSGNFTLRVPKNNEAHAVQKVDGQLVFEFFPRREKSIWDYSIAQDAFIKVSFSENKWEVSNSCNIS